MIPTIGNCLAIAQLLPKISDDRPEWLKTLANGSLNPGDDGLYYQFFHELVQEFYPLAVLEIGTNLGASAAHLAFANDGGFVRTIDINPDAKVQLDRALEGKLVPAMAETADSMVWASEHRDLHNYFDLLFIDGLHNFNQTYGEYVAYRQFVRPGGLIFFDDLELDMATCEMQVFWDLVPEEKQKLDMLHYTGFGVCRKDPNVFVPPWGDIVGRAEMMQRDYAARKVLR
jgi:predicted O-methyltransferase YrrM